MSEGMSLPTLEVTPISPREEDDLVFSCSAQISRISDYFYAFYKNGRRVRNLSPSNQYHIHLAQLEDSGKYTCEIKFRGRHLASEVLWIQIKTDLEPCPDYDEEDDDEGDSSEGSSDISGYGYGDDEDYVLV
ncbi:uncharacterized protein ACNLHF_003541 isoform 2-T2 [Anomaloglossus baeobatrachus]